MGVSRLRSQSWERDDSGNLGYKEEYVPDNKKHGKEPHVDRYRNGTNIGRYNKDGEGIPHKGSMPPKIPRGDIPKFQKAAAKLKFCPLSISDIIELIGGSVAEAAYLKKQMEDGKSLWDALKDLWDAYDDEDFELGDPETWDKKKREQMKRNRCRMPNVG